MKTLLLLFLGIWLIFTLFPLYFMIVTSLKPVEEINRMIPTFWPQTMKLNNYAGIFADPGSLKSLVDSVIVSVTNTALSLFLGTLAGYALARWVRGVIGENLAFWILSNRMFPPVAVIIPMFFLFDSMPWGTDSYFSLIVLYLVFNLPLATWLMMVFFRDAPRELEEAAYLDGYTPFRAFFTRHAAAGLSGHDLGGDALLDLCLERISVRQSSDRHHGQDLPGAYPDVHARQPDAVESGDGLQPRRHAAAGDPVHYPAPLHGARPLPRRGEGLGDGAPGARQVCKGFDRPILDRLSLTVEEGEFFVIVGPSGIGKTTLLRCVAGSRSSMPAASSSAARTSRACRPTGATRP